LLIANLRDGADGQLRKLAKAFRERGINTEIYHQTSPLDRQIRYALRKQIPYVWLCSDGDNTQHAVRELNNKNQYEADPEHWSP
jgi:histidyl-tRNA synthetase